MTDVRTQRVDQFIELVQRYNAGEIEPLVTELDAMSVLVDVTSKGAAADGKYDLAVVAGILSDFITLVGILTAHKGSNVQV